MSVTDQRLTDQWLLEERTKFRSKNIQPGFVPQDINEGLWVFAIAVEDRAAYMRQQISCQEMMERNWAQIEERGIHICPHYGLIELCAQFTGINPAELIEEQEFCGHRGEADFSLLPFSTLPGVSLEPEAMCRKVHEKLSDLLVFAQEPRPKELTGTVNLGKLDSQTLLQLRNTITAYVRRVKDRSVDKEEILNGWRVIVFQKCCISFDSGSGVPDSVRSHFRDVGSAEELSNEEVLQKVSMFQKALMENVLGSEKWWDKPAQKCPHSPERDEGPIVHRDP